MKTCPYCAEEIQDSAVKCKHCGSWLPGAPHGDESPGVRRLRRSSTDRMLAGVCGGAAQHLGMDPTLVRIAYVLISIFTGIVPGLIAYLVMAFVIPDDRSTP